MAKGTVSDPKKPVLDEQALGKLLEAAFVIQEHGGEVHERQAQRKAANAASVNEKKSAGERSAGESSAKTEAGSPDSPTRILPNQIPGDQTPGRQVAASQVLAGQVSPTQVPENPPSTNRVPAIPISPAQTSERSAAASKPISVSEKAPLVASTEKDAYTLTLARIVETQQQILARGLELESAMALVAERAAEMTRASGSAVGVLDDGFGTRKPDARNLDGSKPDAKKLDGKKLKYRAVSGLLTLPRGSEVAMEKALCFNCLRAGEVIRSSDVNSDFLLDTEECKRRGIGALIAVPIYRESGIAGALELYFASPHTFTEQDVHSCQLMAGLITEALARNAGASSRKSLAAERATMLEALEKLRPNLTALMESPAIKESLAKSAAATPAALPSKTAAAPTPATPVPTASRADVSDFSGVSLVDIPEGDVRATIPAKPPAPAFLCRKCGHELVGEEMFCGKCGSPRSSEYQPPTMQSKLASLWHKQQAMQQNAAPAGANLPSRDGMRAAELKNNHRFPAEIQPWEAVLSELSDPFGEPEPEATQELEPEYKPAVMPEPAAQLRKDAIEISAAAKKFSRELDSPVRDSLIAGTPIQASTTKSSIIKGSQIEDSPIKDSLIEDAPLEDAISEEWIESNSKAGLPLEALSAAFEKTQADGSAEYNEEEEAEKTSAGQPAGTALATADPLTWSSAAKAKEAFDQLAAAKNQNSFVRFWHTRRGDVYLAVAVVLVAGVVRWSIASEHSPGANGNAAATQTTAKTSHRRPAPDADLSTFDKLLISLGLADPPEAPADKGNPDTQVWVDLHSALYYCPGADLYGKTPQGKYTTQRDAQLGQFEPAYRKACD